MAVKFKTLSDGSLLFESPLGLTFKSYRQDPDNPCRYVPDFKPCSKRSLHVKTLSCGKKVATWNCSMLNQAVSVSMCQSCGVPDEE